MSVKTSRFLAVIALILLTGALGVYIYNDQSSIGEVASELGEDNLTAAAMSEEDQSAKDVSSVEMPKNFDKPYTASSDQSESSRAESEQIVSELISELKKNPNARTLWLTLGIYRKNAGDYTAAEEVWEYAAKRWPEDIVAYNNLADLYHNYTNEYAKAEEKLLKMISINPAHVPAYRNLYDLYRNKYKTDTDSKEQILLLGLENNPNNLDLSSLLALHYKELGQNDKALLYLNQGMDEAVRLGNEEFITAIQNEIDNL